MKETILNTIGKRIKEVRKKQKLNLQEVADRSNITAGLLSKIENFRTVPSLPVLLNVSRTLNVSMADLVENVVSNKETNYLLVRKADRRIEERDDSQGLTYEGLIQQSISGIEMRTNLVTVNPNCFRSPLSTEAMELIYVIRGSVTYGFASWEVELKEGDTLFFDGRSAHSVSNYDNEKAVLFKVYLF